MGSLWLCPSLIWTDGSQEGCEGSRGLLLVTQHLTGRCAPSCRSQQWRRWMCFASTKLVIGCFPLDIAIRLRVPPQPTKSAAQRDAFIQHLLMLGPFACQSITHRTVSYLILSHLCPFPNLVAMDCLKNNNSTPDVGVLLRLMMRQSVQNWRKAGKPWSLRLCSSPVI